MKALHELLHTWTCTDYHPETDGGWLCRRAAADLIAQGVGEIDERILLETHRELDQRMAVEMPEEAAELLSPDAEEGRRQYAQRITVLYNARLKGDRP